MRKFSDKSHVLGLEKSVRMIYIQYFPTLCVNHVATLLVILLLIFFSWCVVNRLVLLFFSNESLQSITYPLYSALFLLMSFSLCIFLTHTYCKYKAANCQNYCFYSDMDTSLSSVNHGLVIGSTRL